MTQIGHAGALNTQNLADLFPWSHDPAHFLLEEGPFLISHTDGRHHSAWPSLFTGYFRLPTILPDKHAFHIIAKWLAGSRIDDEKMMRGYAGDIDVHSVGFGSAAAAFLEAST